jgi:dTDP-4-amino-4,6-dideoxygalactose transaminase
MIPPIAVPFTPGHIAVGVLRSFSAQGSRFSSELASSLGWPQASLFSSGRSGLAYALQECSTSVRREVIVPTYTCWSVAAAVARAGLEMRVVDVDPDHLDWDPGDLGRAVNARTCAVVRPHLLGRTHGFERTIRCVRRLDESIRVIADCAQGWPDQEERKADACLMSFGRGKPLPLGGGGALLTNEAGSQESVGSEGGSGGWASAMVFAATSALGRGISFRLAERVPGLGIGMTVFEPDFAMKRGMHGWQRALGSKSLMTINQYEQRRRRNAQNLRRALEEAGRQWRMPCALQGSAPLRLGVLAASERARDAAVAGFRERGIGASRLYPGTLLEISDRRCWIVNREETQRGAIELRRRLFTLPCFPGLREEDLSDIHRAMQIVMRNHGS